MSPWEALGFIALVAIVTTIVVCCVVLCVGAIRGLRR